MATVHDVAAYILKKTGEITAMKLQKLVYYAQAWSLVWDEKPLFQAQIEAWANGPVVPELYRHHRGFFKVRDWPKGNPHALSKEQKDTVKGVLNFYGDKSSQWLSDLTHSEEPWRQARKGYVPGERGECEITHASMMEYYSGLNRTHGPR